MFQNMEVMTSEVRNEASITVRGNGTPGGLERSLARIYKLKSAIDEYDREWELVQIFNPEESASNIHVLYRKRN